MKIIFVSFGVAAVVVLALWLAFGGSRVLVVFDSRDRRWEEPLSCWTCDRIDIGRDAIPKRTYDVVVLDGHSLPGERVLNGSTERVTRLIAATSPRLVVAATCYLGEIGVLAKIFDASPRTETVLAAPEALPWTGFSIDDECVLREGPDEGCFHVPDGVRAYRRAEVERLEVAAGELLEDIRTCRRPPPFARLRPLYLCVEDDTAPPALLWVNLHDFESPCAAESPEDLRVVRCGRGGGHDPAPSAAAW